MKDMNWNEAVTFASPYPYLLVTSVDRTGEANAMGVGWWSFTSMKPPLLLVSLAKNRYTLECIRHSKDFVVCFPGEKIAKGAWFCGTKSGRGINKLAQAGLETMPAKKVQSPIIVGSAAVFECVVKSEFETGDHVVVLGEIVSMSGDMDNPMHLYSIFYSKLISMDTKGNINDKLEY